MTARTAPLWSAASDAEEIIQRATEAHIAVRHRAGPHTTPVKVTWSGGLLWFVTPRRSAKGRAARHGPVAALLRAGGRTLVLGGAAIVLDPLRPLTAVRGGARLAPASVRYVRAHAREIAAIARDAAGAAVGELDFSPFTPRVAVGLLPRRAAVLGGPVAASAVSPWAGQRAWPAPPVSLDPPIRSAPTAADWAAALPPELGGALCGMRDAVLTLDSAEGPLPLPCRWDGGTGRAALSREATRLLPRGVSRLSAGLTLVAAKDPGLHGKAGLLLHGVALFAPDGRAPTLRISRVTWWRGMRGGTLRAQDLKGVRRHHA